MNSLITQNSNDQKNDDIFSPLLLKKRCHSCGVKYYDEFYLTKKQLEELFEIDEKVIDWYVEDNLDELKENGYKVLDSEEIENIKNLNNIDLDISNNYIELFSFQTILNISMLMFHGHNTSIVRQNIIKIVMQSLSDIDILKINANIYDKKNGAKNENISSFLENKTYNDSNIKRYIFKSIFQKKADDYYKILHIQYQDSIRSIMNLEITDLIDKYFNILFHDVKELSQKEGNTLSDEVFKELIRN
ncbi:MAG: hypothetical protein LBG67_02970, partial [Campylobacteraceae bacterium]|nr:hypothetical protein [Campylobacteraceae bacterium]